MVPGFLHRLGPPYTDARWDEQGLEPCEARPLWRLLREINE